VNAYHGCCGDVDDDGSGLPGHRSSKEEFCFFHLRHWNLADAMMHAPYVAATLKTWEETGERKLAKLFARMGVPLAACKQKYVHMSHDLVRQLEAKLEEFGREVRARVSQGSLRKRILRVLVRVRDNGSLAPLDDGRLKCRQKCSLAHLRGGPLAYRKRGIDSKRERRGGK